MRKLGPVWSAIRRPTAAQDGDAAKEGPTVGQEMSAQKPRRRRLPFAHKASRPGEICHSQYQVHVIEIF